MAGSLTARAITCGSPPPTPTLGGFSELWSLAIASMAQPRIGSKAAKPDDVALVSKALDEFEAKSGKTPELAAARQALRRQGR